MEFTPYFFESVTITKKTQIFSIGTQTLLQCDFCCILKIKLTTYANIISQIYPNYMYGIFF